MRFDSSFLYPWFLLHLIQTSKRILHGMVFPLQHEGGGTSGRECAGWSLKKSGIQSLQFSSVQFSCSVTSNSSWPHGLQHARLPCLPPAPGVYSNSCPLSQWCYPAISSSVTPFSSRLQSFPASGSFPVSQLFTPGGQSIGALASASVLQWIFWFDFL